MALLLLYAAYTQVDYRDDRDTAAGTGSIAITYDSASYSWDTAQRRVVGPAYVARAVIYNGGFPGDAPDPYAQPYSKPGTEVVDSYTVPSDPGLPGYEMAAAGKARTVYHAGSGTVRYQDGAGCDLALSGVAGMAPGAPGQNGTVGFQLITSNRPATISIFPAADFLAAASRYVPGDGSAGEFSVPPGDYRLVAQDALDCSVGQTVTVPAYAAPARPGCTDPAASNYDPAATVDNGACTYPAAVRTPYFEVPPGQSLRFVQPGRTDRPAFDNTLLADERPLDYVNPGYCQRVEQGDTLVLQALSNYAGAPLLTLRDGATDAVRGSFAGQRVQRGAGATAAFECYLKPDPAAGRTRVYFNDEALPLPFAAGQRVTITGTGTALDGTFPVQAVLEDAAAAVPYLTLTVAYPTAQLRTDATLTTTYAVQAYDTWQFVVPFAAVAAGGCYARIDATDPGFAPARAASEPIAVAARHPDTLLVVYRNFDNAFGLNYSAGLVNRLRVVGRFFERQNGTVKTLERNDDNSLVLLHASVQRKVTLETLLLPGWLHEGLAIALACDFVQVNGLRVVLEQEYAHEPVSRYALSRGTALLEQVGFLGAGNRDDSGDNAPGVDTGGGPFLLAGGNNFLLARP